ncbi:hypothetical protein COLO4_16794 [Corchorus olitorius]|uniref:Uncharacterized protein n=1 Tax=Corchorus olitorius TaxID=93759 RepID=A0A1R3JFJ1_9ROSI|nr:hypothetical protein COLO4_16794 [Corchorus olitorius]
MDLLSLGALATTEDIVVKSPLPSAATVALN